MHTLFKRCAAALALTLAALSCAALCGCDAAPEGFTIRRGVLTDYDGDAINVVIPKTVKEIGRKAFYNTEIVSVSFEEGCCFERIGESSFAHCDALTTVFLPDSVTEWGESAFAGCDLLDTVEVPASLQTIGDCAFSKSTSLQSLDLSACTQLRSIGKEAFWEAHDLTKVTLPEGLQTIGNRAFAFSGVREMTLPASLTQAGYGLFYKSDLKKLTVRTRFKELPESLCYDCTLLEEIALPDSVETVQGFSGCTSLRSVVLPASVKTVSSNAFSDCTSLQTITLKSTAPPELSGSALEDCAALAQIFVPAQSVLDYKTAQGWIRFSSLIAPEE